MKLQNPEVREEYRKLQKLREENPNGNEWMVHLNNFSLNLPGGSMPTYYYGAGIKELDKKPEEEEHYEYYKKKSSELRLSQTNRQFYETIERVIIEDGVLEGVSKCLHPPPHTCIDHEKLHSLVFPSYFRLREMGYNWFDLAA